MVGISAAVSSSGAAAKGPAAFDPKGPQGNDPWYDRSNSQYGVLGSWALEQAGAEIPTAYWQEEDKAWKTAQSPTGGWNYRSSEDEIAQITAT